MMIAERIQNLIHKTETGPGSRIVWILVIVLALGGLTTWYDLWAYHGFSAPEAMDSAQVARNLAEGHGYSTQFVRPFSLYLMQQKHQAGTIESANASGFYPDLANAPVYPTVLAALMKVHRPDWTVESQKHFWSQNGTFKRYEPEFFIAIFNQFLLLAAVALTFFIAKKMFDAQVAWLSALLTLGSSLLWKFSVSGLSTMLLLVIFLTLILCLLKIEALARAESPEPRRLTAYTIILGVLLGLGLLTRYSFGWLVVPAVFFLAMFGGARRTGLAVSLCLTFGVVISPWLARNFHVSHTFFGTAGYAAIEGTAIFPGTKLMQSSAPEMIGNWAMPLVQKLAGNAIVLAQDDLPRLGGWAAILFFAGLLLGLRNDGARRLRYFMLMCLGVFVAVQAVGRTGLSDFSPELNSENLLVLLTPLAIIFGIAFFLTLLDQMNFPAPEVRYVVIIFLIALMWLPLVTNLLPPKPSPTAYPPYHPPEIQKISSWMRPEELMMSDMPWAVAWYGHRPCVWNSVDAKDAFFAINDYFQPVKAVYLTTVTMDGKFFSDLARGTENSWGHFALQVGMKGQFPDKFPLQTPKILISGLLLTDRQRWLNDQ
jgi:Dolichyl-phosphate-mannose-protein mannosyltransferase